MKITLPLTISLVLLTAMIAASLVSWLVAGVNVDLPIHFTLEGTPTRYASAPLALSIIPAAAVFATLVFALTPRLDPKASASPRLHAVLWMFVLAILALGHGLIVHHALMAA
ncbi:hypothetical protein LH464_15530 [Neorhizobium sp. T786]|uniref:hypothetical protein n=1 Tax=Pseudorhizobium xiangyangii TaxID=2883104 RepID=UPI001CFF5D12|nr:hypothetical protein [Neorhizobium xiangyangii]MCB5203883.1 hypothetical protein [Neorhizobium xiangyangii]